MLRTSALSLATSISAPLLALERRAFFYLRAVADGRSVRRTLTRADAGDAAQLQPEHLRVGERGEDLAFFHLRALGYTVVARRWRSARLNGDLDLVAWDGETLVIFEVKTRTSRDFFAAEGAVDPSKQRMLRRMAHLYRRRLPEPWRDLVALRFDVLSVYDLPAGTEFEHIRDAFR